MSASCASVHVCLFLCISVLCVHVPGVSLYYLCLFMDHLCTCLSWCVSVSYCPMCCSLPGIPLFQVYIYLSVYLFSYPSDLIHLCPDHTSILMSLCPCYPSILDIHLS